MPETLTPQEFARRVAELLAQKKAEEEGTMSGPRAKQVPNDYHPASRGVYDRPETPEQREQRFLEKSRQNPVPWHQNTQSWVGPMDMGDMAGRQMGEHLKDRVSQDTKDKANGVIGKVAGFMRGDGQVAPTLRDPGFRALAPMDETLGIMYEKAHEEERARRAQDLEIESNKRHIENLQRMRDPVEYDMDEEEPSLVDKAIEAARRYRNPEDDYQGTGKR